ncbi:LysR family transcriptional regulator [Pseudalkalibacillus decolorationis]|uniref:LysR family transcriptional regulator n=1 Tax=Pseudalkalibacillus decolorationis TaxID=163879 RepID=UPI002148BA94|nr:LysR family transcriptional regulator [Pseudalkalibacillus decolorationis]
MDQQLLVFVTVAEKENFSRAAEELHMTQPAVSQYIQALENTLGTRVLERSNKYVRLNKAGEIVYHHAKEIVGLYSKMQHLIDDLTNNASGKLSIGASYTFGEYILPHYIAQMQTTFPLINPSITIGNTKEIAELVHAHQLDVGIIEGDLKDNQLHIVPIIEDSMYVIAASSHRLSQIEKEVGAADIEKEPWIVREIGSGTREASEKLFKSLGIMPKKILEFGSTQLIKESVESGLGISLLSQWAFRKEQSLGTIKVLKIKNLNLTRKFSIIVRAPYQTKALEVFIDLLHDKQILASLTTTNSVIDLK